MKEYLIGTGGWAYFKIAGLHPLVAYSRAFNFVEVNTTFYEIPPFKQVEKWRRMVPQDFQFTVRAHRTITHKHRFKPTAEALESLEKIRRTCETLKADIIHLQTPSSLKMEQKSINDLRNLLSSVNLGKTKIALETRGAARGQLPPELVKTMQEHNIIHCIDLSKGEMPAYESNVLYSRLFGRGRHNIYQPTDKELKEIDRRATSGKFQKVVLSFHFVRMYKDAVRLKTYKQTGKFPKITRSTGLSSLGEVLREDTKFPTTKEELVHGQGWKLFDVTEEKRMYTVDFLKRLPERKYNNIDEVVDTLYSIIR